MKKLINKVRRWWRTGRMEVRENLDRYRSANPRYVWGVVDVSGLTGDFARLNGRHEVAFTESGLDEAALRARNNQTDKPGYMRG